MYFIVSLQCISFPNNQMLQENTFICQFMITQSQNLSARSQRFIEFATDDLQDVFQLPFQRSPTNLPALPVISLPVLPISQRAMQTQSTGLVLSESFRCRSITSLSWKPERKRCLLNLVSPAKIPLLFQQHDPAPHSKMKVFLLLVSDHLPHFTLSRWNLNGCDDQLCVSASHLQLLTLINPLCKKAVPLSILKILTLSFWRKDATEVYLHN